MPKRIRSKSSQRFSNRSENDCRLHRAIMSFDGSLPTDRVFLSKWVAQQIYLPP